MKRILIFSLAYYPRFVGGAEIAIKEITDRLPSSEYEFHMITNRFDSTLPRIEGVGNVVVHRIGFTSKNPSAEALVAFPLKLNKHIFQVYAAFVALRLHSRYRFDAIWAMMAHSSGIPAALFKLFHPRVPFVLTLQEGDPPERIERMMRPVWPLFRRAFTTADTVQVISTFLGTWARRMGFTGRLEVIPNAVDCGHFDPIRTKDARPDILRTLKKKEGDIFLITTSRLAHKNAVDDILRALALLPERVKFIILGTGPDEAKLRALAEELGVTSRTEFVGHVDHSDLPAYLHVSDIFVRPSRSEGMGNSFIEAMAAELPVIATQEGGIADFLFDAKQNPDKRATGWAVRKDTPEDIASAVLYITEHPDEVKRVTQTAKEMVLGQYDWDLIATEMRERVFEPLIP